MSEKDLEKIFQGQLQKIGIDYAANYYQAICICARFVLENFEPKIKPDFIAYTAALIRYCAKIDFKRDDLWRITGVLESGAMAVSTISWGMGGNPNRNSFRALVAAEEKIGISLETILENAFNTNKLEDIHTAITQYYDYNNPVYLVFAYELLQKVIIGKDVVKKQIKESLKEYKKK